MVKKRTRIHANMNWRTIDLHLHTPASVDYQQPDVTPLDLLYQAEARGVDLIAFTDHNTVAGFRRMQEEIERLQFLESSERILTEEQGRLREYRRLLKKILVLPAFEFTATFGFHILGIFSPEKSVREIEHLLLELQIPPDLIDQGSDTVGATTDVLTAYRMIDESGGLVIAAHANSNHGVAMRNFPFGGQTRIAYTQDLHLHALEVTDLEQRGRRTTAAFFSGTKPEYPRRMHCIQGSDAHRLIADPQRRKILGIGERVTDVLLPEVSFEALKDLFLSNDFARTRPHRIQAEPAFDFVQAAREEGANLVQDFHENMSVRGGRLYAILADVCAFANTNGGTLYVGLSADPKKPVTGISNVEQSIAQIEKEISNRISPPFHCSIDAHQTSGKNVLRVLVPRGEDPPYVLDDYKIYVRAESETGMAVRDEVVGLVWRGQRETLPSSGKPAGLPDERTTALDQEPVEEQKDLAPRTGVEVVAVEERNGGRYYTMRDLRNGNVVKNVTHKSARRLWHYAITQYDKTQPDPQKTKIQWDGNFGLLRQMKQDKYYRYDLVQREPGGWRYYFGVTEEGIHGPWKLLLGQEDD